MKDRVEYLEDLISRIDECVNVPYTKLRNEVKYVIASNKARKKRKKMEDE